VICAKPSTLCTHSQGNIEEVFVCHYIQNLRACHHRKKNKKTNIEEVFVCCYIQNLRACHHRKKNKKTKPRERRKKIKNKNCVLRDTYYVPQMIFFVRKSVASSNSSIMEPTMAAQIKCVHPVQSGFAVQLTYLLK
jgi:hypothetical protein